MQSKTRAIVATSIGNMLEWYDFTVYALFAGYIAGNFFPGDDANSRHGQQGKGRLGFHKIIFSPIMPKNQIIRGQAHFQSAGGGYR